jgi:hypothetical protein
MMAGGTTAEFHPNATEIEIQIIVDDDEIPAARGAQACQRATAAIHVCLRFNEHDVVVTDPTFAHS